MSVTIWLIAMALVLLPGLSAMAQQFPSKPISFVIPYQPGGNVDVTARILQKAIGEGLGQPIVIENKPG
jgi:tripartite-type tricarboxylate transporter receptor subunit TctC